MPCIELSTFDKLEGYILVDVKSKNEAWKHVDTFDRIGNDGTSKRIWRCKYCREKYTGNVARVEAHLGCVAGFTVGSCPSVPPDLKDSMASTANMKKNIREEKKKRKYNPERTDSLDPVLGWGNSQHNAVEGGVACPKQPMSIEMVGSGGAYSQGLIDQSNLPLKELGISDTSSCQFPTSTIDTRRQYPLWNEGIESNLFYNKLGISGASSCQLGTTMLSDLLIAGNNESNPGLIDQSNSFFNELGIGGTSSCQLPATMLPDPLLAGNNESNPGLIDQSNSFFNELGIGGTSSCQLPATMLQDPLLAGNNESNPGDCDMEDVNLDDSSIAEIGIKSENCDMKHMNLNPESIAPQLYREFKHLHAEIDIVKGQKKDLKWIIDGATRDNEKVDKWLKDAEQAVRRVIDLFENASASGSMGNDQLQEINKLRKEIQSLLKPSENLVMVALSRALSFLSCRVGMPVKNALVKDLPKLLTEPKPQILRAFPKVKAPVEKWSVSKNNIIDDYGSSSWSTELPNEFGFCKA